MSGKPATYEHPKDKRPCQVCGVRPVRLIPAGPSAFDHVGECVRCRAPYQTHAIGTKGERLNLLECLRLLLPDHLKPLALMAWDQKPPIPIEVSHFRKEKRDGGSDFERFVGERMADRVTKPSASEVCEVWRLVGEGGGRHWESDTPNEYNDGHGNLVIDPKAFEAGALVIVVQKGKP